MLETLCSRKKQIRIAGEDFPNKIVKSRLLKLDDSHIEYVLECLDRNTTDIRNIRSYILTALYQAPTTINSPLRRAGQPRLIRECCPVKRVLDKQDNTVVGYL